MGILAGSDVRAADLLDGVASRAGESARAEHTTLTGIIVELARSRRIGVIRAQDGLRVLFSASAVLGSFETLAIGHRVRFDLDRAWPRHNAVRVLREPSGSSTPNRVKSGPDLRYRGFDQAQNVRSYKFDAVRSGDAIQHFVVTVDLALLLKHHIGVQEGPVLCLQKLAADLEGSPDSQWHELGNEDLLAYALSRTAVLQRKRPKAAIRGRRGSPPPGPWKHRPEAC